MKAASYGIVDFKTITNKSLSIQARAIYAMQIRTIRLFRAGKES